MAIPMAFQILRYCYNPDRLHAQLLNYTSNFPDADNVCALMFDGDSCHGFEAWNDGGTYEDGIKVSHLYGHFILEISDN